jgi:hypothetical protein
MCVHLFAAEQDCPPALADPAGRRAVSPLLDLARSAASAVRLPAGWLRKIKTDTVERPYNEPP